MCEQISPFGRGSAALGCRGEPSHPSARPAPMAPHPARAPARHRQLCGTRAVVLPGFRVFLGSVGCGADLLIVLFNSYLQIQFLKCSNYQREKTTKTSVRRRVWRARGCPNAVLGIPSALPVGATQLPPGKAATLPRAATSPSLPRWAVTHLTR